MRTGSGTRPRRRFANQYTRRAKSDGDPLPSFRGDPLWLPLEGAPAAILERYWSALDAANRVALAVKRIPAGGGPGSILVRNQYA